MKDGKLRAIDVAYRLGISIPTLNTWYKWYLDEDAEKPEDMPELPMYTKRTAKPTSTRYWVETDIPKIKAFQEWLPKGRNGLMAKYNSMYWYTYKKNKARKEREKL